MYNISIKNLCNILDVRKIIPPSRGFQEIYCEDRRQLPLGCRRHQKDVNNPNKYSFLTQLNAE